MGTTVQNNNTITPQSTVQSPSDAAAPKAADLASVYGGLDLPESKREQFVDVLRQSIGGDESALSELLQKLDNLPPAEAKAALARGTELLQSQAAAKTQGKSQLDGFNGIVEDVVRKEHPDLVGKSPDDITPEDTAKVKSSIKGIIESSLAGTNQELAKIGARIANKNSAMEDMTKDVNKLSMYLNHPDKVDRTKPLTVRVTTFNPSTGKKEHTFEDVPTADPDAFAKRIGEIRTGLNDAKKMLGDSISQVDQLEIQRHTQAQQRFLMLLSNLAKMNHDTLKAIIGNIKA